MPSGSTTAEHSDISFHKWKCWRHFHPNHVLCWLFSPLFNQNTHQGDGGRAIWVSFVFFHLSLQLKRENSQDTPKTSPFPQHSTWRRNLISAVGSWYFPIAAGSVPWSRAELDATQHWGCPKMPKDAQKCSKMCKDAQRCAKMLGAQASPGDSCSCWIRTC